MQLHSSTKNVIEICDQLQILYSCKKTAEYPQVNSLLVSALQEGISYVVLWIALKIFYPFKEQHKGTETNHCGRPTESVTENALETRMWSPT